MAIVVSHIADDFDSLARQALRQAPLADLIELRLDRIGHPGLDALTRFMAESPKPVIVTVHGAEAFGSFEGSVDERLALLEDAGRAGAAFVDIDWTLSLELGEFEGKCHRIVSRHDVEGTPEDLDAFDEDVRAVMYEGDVIKLVTHASRTEDGLEVLRFLRRARGGLVAFCSGAAGSFTRVLAPIFGSPFTYAAPADLPGMPAGEGTAPGQWRVNDLLACMPPGGLTPETAIFGVVGRPIGHSVSPRVHGMALKNAQLDAVYVAFEPEEWSAFIELADDENFRGFSVTAPFKEQAFEHAAIRDDACERLGAANTLLRDGARWRGYNTDAGAVRETLERAFVVHGREPGRPVTASAAKTLVLGTGGAARSVLGALQEIGGEHAVAGRDRAKAAKLAEAFRCEVVDWDRIGEFPYDALIHCTPLGTAGRPQAESELPIPAEALRPNTLVLDAVYRPLRTPLLELARSKGCTPVPGAEWFVRQAMSQFGLFTHQDPDESLMRAAFEHALGLGEAP